MRSLIFHLRYTVRQLLKSPGFTITAVLILGLGIGANTAIFSLVNGVLLKPLPYPNADRLFHLYRTFKSDNAGGFDYPDFGDYCASQHSFKALAAYTSDWFHLSSQGPVEQLPGLYVSGGFFKVMGRPLILGRPLEDADDRPESAAVVVLTEHLWRTHFNSDPNIVGTNITLNSRSFQVVGVTAGQADEEFKVELYTTTNQDPSFAPNKRIRRGAPYFECVGRLKDGVTLQQAQADLEVIQGNLIAMYPATDAGYGIRIAPYLEGVVSDYSETVWLLEAAVACLLLITCANVGNLLLARAQDRFREVSIRAALGASRSRLAVQLLTESILLSVGGAIIGVGIAAWSLQAIKNADSSALRQTIAGIDPNLPVTSIYPFDQVIYDSFASRRLQMTLVAVFSAAALVLAVVGLYGVLSYSVSLRKRELGVRMALGAQAFNILGLVVGHGLRIAGVGLMVGLISALTLNHLIEWALFGVSAADPISFGASVLVLVAAALVACLLPALRATRIDPIRALRE